MFREQLSARSGTTHKNLEAIGFEGEGREESVLRTEGPKKPPCTPEASEVYEGFMCL